MYEAIRKAPPAKKPPPVTVRASAAPVRRAAAPHAPAPHSLQRLGGTPIQRAIVPPAAMTAAQQTAYDHLLAAARSDATAKTLIDFAEGNNNTNLTFFLKDLESRGFTELYAGNTDISSEAKLLQAFGTANGAAALAGAAYEIRISVDPQKMNDQGLKFDVLQTLAHEFAVHAAKFPAGIKNLKKIGAIADANVRLAALTEYAKSFTSGSMSPGQQHDDYVFGADAHYSALRTKIRTRLGQDVASFDASEASDVKINLIQLAMERALRTHERGPETNDELATLLAAPVDTLRTLASGKTTFDAVLKRKPAPEFKSLEDSIL